jgi:hypothetical protein
VGLLFLQSDTHEAVTYMSGVESIMNSHEADTDIAVLKSRVSAIESAIITLTKIQIDIAEIKTKMAQMESYKPGATSYCQTQDYKINEVTKRLSALEIWRDETVKRLAAWVGGISVILVVVTIFAPNIRELLTKP